MSPKVVMTPGAALWRLVLRQHGDTPVVAMRTLRAAGASAKTRARLAVEVWGGGDPELVCAALLTLRSCEAIRWALDAMGWDEATPDPQGAVTRLRSLAGIERIKSSAKEAQTSPLPLSEPMATGAPVPTRGHGPKGGRRGDKKPG